MQGWAYRISISTSILSTIHLKYRYRYRRYFYLEVSKAVSTILLQQFLSILRYRYFLLTFFTFSTGQSTVQLACRCDNRHAPRIRTRAYVIDHRHEGINCLYASYSLVTPSLLLRVISQEEHIPAL
jgi:hypothetical protein